MGNKSTVWLRRGPKGEPQRFEADPDEISRLMVEGWRQSEAPEGGRAGTNTKETDEEGD